MAVLLVVGVGVFLLLAKDHIRSLWSLRRIPNTNMYVMDYYGGYNAAGLYENGVDVHDIPGSLIRNFFPGVLVPIADAIGGHPQGSRPGEPENHSCASISFRTEKGEVLFGRNFDWRHDPCVIVRVHGKDGPSSVAVLDPYYLQLDEAKLENLGLFRRLRLLLAPYLIFDGMNQWGVAVSTMAVKESQAAFDPQKPTVIKPLMQRLILDYAHDTEQAVALIRRFNLDFSGAEFTGGACHFMIADASGKSVVVEFVEGRIEVVAAARPWQVATNHLLVAKPDADNCKRCPRYAKAWDTLARPNGEMDPAKMMQLMSSISVENWTMWTSVYNLTTGDFQVAYRRQYNDLFSGHLDRQ